MDITKRIFEAQKRVREGGVYKPIFLRLEPNDYVELKNWLETITHDSKIGNIEIKSFVGFNVFIDFECKQSEIVTALHNNIERFKLKCVSEEKRE